jgi:RND family efflux transporter MFP subunit
MKCHLRFTYSTLLTGFLLFSASFTLLANSEKRAPVPVTTQLFRELALYPTRDAPATAVSINDTQLSAEITGTLLEITPQIGDKVLKGDLLAKLDCTDHTLAVEQFLATYRSAKSDEKLTFDNLERAKKLFKAKAGSEETLSIREAEYEKASAIANGHYGSLQSARNNVSKCEILAPFNAVVLERYASIGEYAMPGKLLFRLLDQEQIEVSANIQEQDIDQLSQSDEITFVSGNKHYPLALRTILPILDSRLKSFPVRLDFLSEKSSPGETGRIHWRARMAHIPAQFLVFRNQEPGIFTVSEGRANFVPLPGALPGHPAPVNIPEETPIVVEGRFFLNHGDPVSLRN